MQEQVKSCTEDRSAYYKLHACQAGDNLNPDCLLLPRLSMGDDGDDGGGHGARAQVDPGVGDYEEKQGNKDLLQKEFHCEDQ